MRLSAWLAAVLIGACGCAATYESQPAAPADARPAPSLSLPGCQEPVHQPFPAPGSYVAVDELPEAITSVPPTSPETPAVEGTVLIRALVCEHGRVVQTEVVKSIPMLDEAAREAVMRWTFRPARSAGQPIAVWVDAPVRFGSK